MYIYILPAGILLKTGHSQSERTSYVVVGAPVKEVRLQLEVDVSVWHLWEMATRCHFCLQFWNFRADSADFHDVNLNIPRCLAVWRPHQGGKKQGRI